MLFSVRNNRPTLHCVSSVATHLPDVAPFRSEAISRSGVGLSDGNCQANSRQTPFAATTQVPAKDIDMDAIAQSGVRHSGNSLYGRGHPVKSFKSVRGRPHVDIATVQTGDPQNQRSVHLLASSRSVPSSAMF